MEDWFEYFVKIIKVLLLMFVWNMLGHSSSGLPSGTPQSSYGETRVFPSGKLSFSSSKLLLSFGKPCLCLCTYTVSPFCVFAPSENSLVSLCLHPCPPNCWEYLLRPSRRGVPCIVSLFAFSGPGRKAKFIVFLLPPPFAPKNVVDYSLYLSRGGDKLHGVSSISLQGVGPGPMGKPQVFLLENFGFPFANCWFSLGSLANACALTL